MPLPAAAQKAIFSLYNVILSLVHNFIRAVFPDRQRLQGVQSLFFPVAQKFQIFVVHYYITFPSPSTFTARAAPTSSL